ncbi:MAG: HmuY family protein [Fidelibacterota bacterium]
MKYPLMVIFLLSFLTQGCEDKKGQNLNPLDEGVNSYTSVNIKQGGPEYFTFADNEGTLTEPAKWDMAFATVEFVPAPGAPAIQDPVILTGTDVPFAKLDAADLSTVTDVPAATLFKTDDTGEYVTQGWYDYNPETHLMTPKDYVFVVNTSDGKYPAFEITSYYDDDGNSGTISIQWKYLVK